LFFNDLENVVFLRQILCIIKKNSLSLENKSKFVSLKRILPILSIILLTAIHSNGQASRNTPANQVEIVLNLYPNPATTYVTFDFPKGIEKGYSIQVFSFLGRKMFESQNLSPKTTVDLTEYNRGVYIYHLRDQSGKVLKSGKFQVSK
jgi:hypothetical protein